MINCAALLLTLALYVITKINPYPSPAQALLWWVGVITNIILLCIIIA
ncbi:hypothetical protein ETP1_011 [Edwardsiella phage ETP-1]|uniref:Uncharacterized protein n=3 Tax=Kafunavirus KF1 TaxID=1982588 RepID=A0A6G5P4X8_9CAUD|nr:hypothetical protein D877_gp13 [Edwardsiella phage KF-1]QBP07012.1 hypothetical protein ETP1_011 [Edwardsiella phage ETP-1]BAM63061.1 hypothetical protein [Edwardsiella phage KF-1]BAM63110.1 hypothetical protein [Edwardsiella phage IW-1]